MPSRTTARCGYLLAGRVQGVGFRWWTRKTALQLGLTGTVRNLSDGRVEVHAAGEPDSLATFREYLEAGPPGARVREVVVTPAPVSLSDDFVITG